MSEAPHVKSGPTGAGGKHVGKVKNKLPAPIQITAEQLLREAKERQLEIVPPPPRQKITDPTELAEYRMRKRKQFEDNIRKNRSVMVNWIKYARWEEETQEYQRARSVYERALDVDHRCVPIWLKYTEMEMRHKQVNHARNLWDRAVTLLPRVSQFWYKYTYMEEMLENVAGARQVFERWMEWEPEEQSWSSYINMELRYKEIDRARSIYEKFVLVHPTVKNWIRFAKFEEKHGNIAGARGVYERAVDFFGEEYMEEGLFIGFAKFEEGQKESERARAIYKYALEKLTKEQCPELFKSYSIFEKKFGDRRGIEDVIINKRRFKYETEIKHNPLNYDAWFDLLRLLEADGSLDDVRDTYERAIANIPLVASKKGWRRYIYLWINYALFEELEAEDVDKTREVYKGCLDVIPHKKFTFGKIWLMFAQFEIRQKNLDAARKILGTSIGKCPKPKLFKGYIDLELQMREFDRCRKIYEKFLEHDMSNCNTWMKFAELETILGDTDRARAIFNLAIQQPLLDMPEILWKAYIDFEVEEEEHERVRALYKALLQRTKHVKVWISFANFEASIEQTRKARDIFEEADRSLQLDTQKEERVLCLEAWKEFEIKHGTEETQDAIKKKLPRRVKKRRKIDVEEGGEGGWEEYWDYIFPDSEANSSNLKFLQMAKAWKKQQNTEDSDSDDDDDDDDNEDTAD